MVKKILEDKYLNPKNYKTLTELFDTNFPKNLESSVGTHWDKPSTCYQN